MGLVLKGIELENFKSYINKQYVSLSDLSVLLGANSSGKSTALQALLTIKQTMECNSPDEELLLSGKYVVLGDFNEVISNPEKETFSFSAILSQTEKSETMSDGDSFKIIWNFKKDDDGTSVILDYIDIFYESMCVSLKRGEEGRHNLYVNGNRKPLSVIIENLLLAEYYGHYDEELNHKGGELLNALSRILISPKTPTVAVDKPIGVDAVSGFYMRLLDNTRDKGMDNVPLSDEKKNLVLKTEKLIEEFSDLELGKYDYMSNIFQKDLKKRILEFSFAKLESIEKLDEILLQYEKYLNEYKSTPNDASEYQGIYRLGHKLFWEFDRGDEKLDTDTQLKYALDFYNAFYEEIISNIFFVGPIRETPKGLYNIGFETIPKYVGPTGSYFASVLLHEDKKEKEYILPDGEKETCKLSEALASWMVHLNVANSVAVDKKNSFGFSVSVENMEQVKSDIMNVGIGTSQVLPVLISVLLSEENEILVFEQPELHLHPYSQSRLADMFVEFCKHGRKIILETHSEHFLLRLRYHIVKEHYSKDAATVNFFHNSGGTKVEVANISGYGNIEYPVDFRDETQELLNSIIKATLERKGLS